VRSAIGVDICRTMGCVMSTGCAMSTVLSCLLCNHRCSVDRLASRFAFFPPTPSSYSIDITAAGSFVINFANPEIRESIGLLSHLTQSIRVDAMYLDTSRKQRIAVIHFVYPGVQTTLLWSHGNAMDIGELYLFFIQLCLQMRVNVVAYDYSGYGASTGTPSERDCHADITAVYHYLQSCGLDTARDLILYGQSVGSGPTLWLGTKRKVRAIVLHTPILSGLRVLIPPAPGSCTAAGCCSPICVYALCDPFNNWRRIERVTCPVLMIHGTLDTTVDASHTAELYRRCPEACRREPYIVRGANHDNIVEFDPGSYFSAVTAFLQSLDDACDGQLQPAPSIDYSVEAPFGATPNADGPSVPLAAARSCGDGSQ